MAAFLSIVIAVGCGGGSTNNGTGGTGGTGGGGTPPPPPPPPPPGPTLTNFTLTPAIAGTGANGVGQFVNFNWTTANATSLTVTPIINGDDQALPLQGPFQDTSAPTSTTTFTGTASNGTVNSAPATVTLTVVPVTFTSSVTTIEAGNTVTLTYGGPNNGSSWQLLIGGNPNPTPLPSPACSGNTCTGTYTTAPLNANTTFTVAANGPVGGQAESTALTITVGGATTITLTANPQNIQPGASSTLTWVSQNASAVTITPGLGNEPLSGSTSVSPTQTTTYTATATSIYPNTPPVTASATVTVNTGGVGNLNHIIYMLQENRAFDNYFGVFANYRVNVDHIPGAQMSDVNDLHTLPPGYTIKNPQGQSFGPFHARTVCIENLSPSWDETHYDMDLVGNDWMNLTPELAVQDGPLPRHHLVGRQRRSVRSDALPAARLLRSDRSAVLLRTGRAVCHQRHLVLAHSGEYGSESHVLVLRHLVRTRLPAAESQRSRLAGRNVLPRAERRACHLALLLSGQQRLPGELGRLE